MFGETVTRERILQSLSELDLEWPDEEDAGHLLDLLMEAYTAPQAASWLLFYCPDLGGIPVNLLQQGRAREVFIKARRLIAA